ncbi:MAG: ABC transporter ATP-binding protein [Cyanobacteria bacterium P01_F01_bin.150]
MVSNSDRTPNPPTLQELSTLTKPQLSSLLSVRDLTVEFRTRSGVVTALEHISFHINQGETIGIVGESGSGKSVLAMAIMGILDRAGKVTNGEVLWSQEQDNSVYNLLQMPDKRLRQLRGKELSMIFQNPRVALNPIRKVGQQLADVLRCHTTLSGAAIKTRAIELLASVNIPDPQQRYHAYPYELSGGQCQRIMIALALACTPKLLIADEPTTGLDVTTQATVMNLLRDLTTERQMATIVITHDLALASQYCDRILVMYAGHLVESAPAHTLFAQPSHPYTMKLINSYPQDP